MITRRSVDPPNPPTHPSSSKSLSSSRQRAGSTSNSGPLATGGSGGGPLFRTAAADPALPAAPSRRRSPSPDTFLMQPPPVPSTSGSGSGVRAARNPDAADSAPRDPRVRPSPVRQTGPSSSSGSNAAHNRGVGWAEAVERAEGGLAAGAGGAAPPPQAGPGPRSAAATQNSASASSIEEVPRGNVIDLTSSSPPASARRRLVPAARFAGLALPELGGSGPSASSSRRRSTRTSVPPVRAEVVISSDDDDSDDPDYTTAATSNGRAGPSSYAGPSAFHPAANVGRARRALPARAARATRFDTAYATDSDSEIEVVSERPASRSPPPVRPSPPPSRARYSQFGAPIASPPPFVVPDGATPTTGASSRRRSNPRRSTRIQAGADAPMNLPDDPVEADAALARALAQADANDRGFQDYLAGQTYGTGSGGPSRATASRGGRGGAASGGAASAAAGGGGGRGYRGLLSDQGLIDLLMTSGSPIYEALGGALWRGGMNVFGGAGSTSSAYYGGGGGYGGPVGGWGGAAKVKAASKKYGVRMSHPTPVERGFSRDIVEPRDPDAPAPEPSTTSATKKSRSKKSTEELEPVCASCLETLLLSGTGDKKVFGLRCGHVVCARCLNEAKARCRAIREQEKGGWVVDADGPAKNGYKASSGKGKGKAPEMPGTLSLDDDDELATNGASNARPAKRRRQNGSDAALLPSASSQGNKGKGKSRANETGVEEDWTTCPVANCDGKGSDLLAEEGWNRPYELFA